MFDLVCVIGVVYFPSVEWGAMLGMFTFCGFVLGFSLATMVGGVGVGVVCCMGFALVFS